MKPAATALALLLLATAPLAAWHSVTHRERFLSAWAKAEKPVAEGGYGVTFAITADEKDLITACTTLPDDDPYRNNIPLPGGGTTSDTTLHGRGNYLLFQQYLYELAVSLLKNGAPGVTATHAEIDDWLENFRVTRSRIATGQQGRAQSVNASIAVLLKTKVLFTGASDTREFTPRARACKVIGFLTHLIGDTYAHTTIVPVEAVNYDLDDPAAYDSTRHFSPSDFSANATLALTPRQKFDAFKSMVEGYEICFADLDNINGDTDAIYARVSGSPVFASAFPQDIRDAIAPDLDSNKFEDEEWFWEARRNATFTVIRKALTRFNDTLKFYTTGGAAGAQYDAGDPTVLDNFGGTNTPTLTTRQWDSYKPSNYTYAAAVTTWLNPSGGSLSEPANWDYGTPGVPLAEASIPRGAPTLAGNSTVSVSIIYMNGRDASFTVSGNSTLNLATTLNMSAGNGTAPGNATVNLLGHSTINLNRPSQSYNYSINATGNGAFVHIGENTTVHLPTSHLRVAPNEYTGANAAAIIQPACLIDGHALVIGNGTNYLLSIANGTTVTIAGNATLRNLIVRLDSNRAIPLNQTLLLRGTPDLSAATLQLGGNLTHNDTTTLLLDTAPDHTVQIAALSLNSTLSDKSGDIEKIIRFTGNGGQTLRYDSLELPAKSTYHLSLLQDAATGNASLVHNATATLALDRENTITGCLSAERGALLLAHGQAAATAAVVISPGAQLHLNPAPHTLRAIVLGDAASLRLSNPAKATIANVPNILTLLEPENSLVAGAPAALVLHRLVLTDTAAAQTYHLTRNATVRNSYDLIAGLPPPFNPRALSADDFLAYALIPGPDAEVPQTGGGLSHLPAVRLAGGDLSMTFRPARAGFTYQPQKSTDLRTWENLFAPVTPSVPGAPPVTIEAPADSPRQFLRLKITAPNE